VLLNGSEALRGRSLGDQRRLKRLRPLVISLTAHSAATLAQALCGWAPLKAADRFCSTAAITPAGSFATALPAGVERCAAAGFVLILPDTTTLDYSAQPTTAGLGHVGRGKQQGFVAHTALCLDVRGAAPVPGGVLAQERWVRPRRATQRAKTRRTRGVADKERARWLRVAHASLAALPPGGRAVTVAAREADIFALVAAQRPAHADLLIRATPPRRVAAAAGTRWPAVAAAPVCGAHRVTRRRADDRPARTAVGTVRTRRVTLRPPQNQRAGEPWTEAVTLTAILVAEGAPPAGTKAVGWLLLTTRAVPDLATAQQAITWYSDRWLSERDHFVLQSGGRVQAWQLGTLAALERAFAVACLVAWRVLWLTSLARAQPLAPGTAALRPDEWQALACHVQQRPPPPTAPPSLREAVRQIAALGGFRGRTGDGDPGLRTVWRGLTRLQDRVHAYRLLRAPHAAVREGG